MMTIARIRRLATAPMAVGALSALAAPAALGALTASPNPSTTGSYTVSGSVTATRAYEWFSLIETGPGGTQSFSLASASGISRMFSGKTSGTYVYRVEGCYLETVPDLEEVLDKCEFVGAALSVIVNLAPADRFPGFGDTPAASRSWHQNSPITSFTFEAATGGDGTLTYTASGLPAGVAMSSARRISGTPTAAGSGTATIEAKDADGDTASKSFAWTVAEDLVPRFGSSPVAARSWVRGQFVSWTFESTTGGDAPLTYASSGLPAGVRMSSALAISGTPSAAGSGTATITATDADGDEASKSFSWTVAAVTFGLTASPNPSGTGSYTVTGSAPTSRAYDSFRLLETAPGGTRSTFAIGGPLRFSRAFTGRSAGSYVYRAQGCAFEPHPVYQEAVEVCTNLGPSLTVRVDSTPTFGNAPAPSRSWKQNEPITAFTFESATGGDGTLTYTASGLPAGITMSSARRISGTPSAAGSGTATITATDADGDEASKSFAWAVAEDLVPVFGACPAMSWTKDRAITLVRLQATGGDAPLSYRQTGLPAGMTMSGSGGVSGMPTDAGSGTVNATVEDADGDSDNIACTWTVTEDGMPAFSATPLPARHWTENEPIAAFTFEAATGGDAPLSYSASGLPAGVAMSSARWISGTPTTSGSGTATITARDADGDTASKSFSWTVKEPPDPPEPPVLPPLSARSWTVGQPLEAFTLPAATGGDAPIRYTISGLPAGLSMSSARVVSGIPTSAGTGTATLTATDNTGATARGSFAWTVAENPRPSFGGMTIGAQSWNAGSGIAPLPAPAATGGDAPLHYGARGLPDGIALVKSGNPPAHAFSGTPTKADSGTATLMAVDRDGDRATLSFAWTVKADTAPSFAGTAALAPKTWALGQAIGAFGLPAASGGNGALSYGARGLPDGVTVSPLRRVSGVPLAAGSGTAVLTAMDADGDTATFRFRWTVTSSDAPKGKLLSVNPEPTTTNDYTITGSYSGARDYVTLKLSETGPAGHTQAYSPSSGRFSQAIANRANGSYTYTLTGCYLKQVPGLQEVNDVCERIGDPLTVTVAGPAPDSVAAQLDDTWEARVGDIDGDALKDVYLKRTSTAVGGGLLPDVLLRQAAGGVISVEPAPPGSTNASTAATWPVSTALDVILNDIDMDGFVDILLRGVHAAVGASGADAAATVPDQIVYAPGRRPEVVLNAVDDGVKNFLSEVDGWFRDPAYFTTRVREDTVTIIRYRTQCLSDLGSGYGDDLDDVCFRIPIVDTLTIQVPTNLSTDARTFAGQFDVDEGQIDPDVTPGSSAAITLSQTLKRVFGVEILGGRLENTCTGSFTYEDRLDLPCDKPHLIGRTILGWALDIFGSAAQAQTTDSNVTVQLPSPSPGLRTYGGNFPPGWDATCPEGSTTPCTHRTGQYGTSGTINDVVELGKQWTKKYPNGPPIYVGDISVENGGAWPTYENGNPWHRDHRDGKKVDVRPIHKDGEDEVLTWESPDYDQAKTKELLKMIFEDTNVKRVIFNDPALFVDDDFADERRLTRDSQGNAQIHDNHIHIEYEHSETEDD